MLSSEWWTSSDQKNIQKLNFVTCTEAPMYEAMKHMMRMENSTKQILSTAYKSKCMNINIQV